MRWHRPRETPRGPSLAAFDSVLKEVYAPALREQITRSHPVWSTGNGVPWDQRPPVLGPPEPPWAHVFLPHRWDEDVLRVDDDDYRDGVDGVSLHFRTRSALLSLKEQVDARLAEMDAPVD